MKKNKLSQKLLTLSRTDTQMDSSSEISYTKDTIEKAVRMLSATAAKNNITIHCDVCEDYPILIGEDDLYQVLFNLIENGIKYNTPNGHLYISLTSKDNNVEIKIEDTGAGIPEESLPHIFERFYRVDKARSRSSGGSGLGLSIVSNIIKRNNGVISVASSIGKGTTFTLQFPICTAKEDTQ